MKFLHTADWQVGMKAAHVGDKADEVREERLAAAQRVMDLAVREQVDAVLLAGDVFEHNAVRRDWVQRVADILGRSGLPVYILPGNHDPLVPGSVWDHSAWSYSNITILREREPIRIGGAVLYPCPVYEKTSRYDPTAWIDATGETDVCIGIAHGTVEGAQVEEPDYPIARDRAQRAGLDYLALGHWHSTTPYFDAQRAVRMAYAGTPESTKFGERNSGNVLIVDIPARGAPPVVREEPTGRLRWEQWQRAVRASEDLAHLRREIELYEAPERTLLEVQLSGILPAGAQRELERIAELVAARFLIGRVKAGELFAAPEDDGWTDGLPAGMVRQVAKHLRDWSDPHFAGERPKGVTPQLASLALLELFAWTRGGSGK